MAPGDKERQHTRSISLGDAFAEAQRVGRVYPLARSEWWMALMSAVVVTGIIVACMFADGHGADAADLSVGTFFFACGLPFVLYRALRAANLRVVATEEALWVETWWGHLTCVPWPEILQARWQLRHKRKYGYAINLFLEAPGYEEGGGAEVTVGYSREERTMREVLREVALRSHLHLVWEDKTPERRLGAFFYLLPLRREEALWLRARSGQPGLPPTTPLN